MNEGSKGSIIFLAGIVYGLCFGFVTGVKTEQGIWHQDCEKLERHLSDEVVYSCKKAMP